MDTWAKYNLKWPSGDFTNYKISHFGIPLNSSKQAGNKVILWCSGQTVCSVHHTSFSSNCFIGYTFFKKNPSTEYWGTCPQATEQFGVFHAAEGISHLWPRDWGPSSGHGLRQHLLPFLKDRLFNRVHTCSLSKAWQACNLRGFSSFHTVWAAPLEPRLWNLFYFFKTITPPPHCWTLAAERVERWKDFPNCMSAERWEGSVNSESKPVRVKMESGPSVVDDPRGLCPEGPLSHFGMQRAYWLNKRWQGRYYYVSHE